MPEWLAWLFPLYLIGIALTLGSTWRTPQMTFWHDLAFAVALAAWPITVPVVFTIERGRRYLRRPTAARYGT
jgi:hypothetical protein